MESERASRAAETLEAFSTVRVLKAALETISAKDREVNTARATQAVAEAKSLADVAAAQAEVSTAKAEAEDAIAAAQVEASKATEDEFTADFFQGYSDLKRRVAEDHPEWDLTGYSRVNSDYWEAEASVEGGVTPIEDGAGSMEAGDAAREAAGVGGQETLETQASVGAEQIVDDEPAA